jgi:CRP/FNR family transcriptional regulator
LNARNDGPLGPGAGGPNIIASGLWNPLGKPGRLLTEEERAQLAVISSVSRFSKGTLMYREGDRADAVFNIVAGVAKSYRTLPDGSRHIAGFLFPDDLVGLAEEGRYTNSAQAVTPLTAYKIPTTTLEAKLHKEPRLEFHVICKLCHDLREAQRHAFLLGRRHALPKVGLFLEMLESYYAAREEGTEEIYLPMSRSDISDYIGISLEAVSRSFQALVRRGVIAFRDRRHVKIVNRPDLEAIISGS